MVLKKLFSPPKEGMERIYFLFIWLIRILLIGALILEGIYQRWELFFVTALSLFLTILPTFFERRYQIKLPPEFHAFIVFLVYTGFFLGENHKFYFRFLWWDTMLHTLTGFVMGIVGFAIMFILYKGDKIKASPSAVAFFAFCFSMTLAVIWEIFEFAMDYFFGMNMQKVHIGTGVTDTMVDLIVNAIGALIASIIGFFYLKYEKSKIYHRILGYFRKENPHLFKKSSK
jgi:uncharacterized membrane protein YjdF